MAYFELMSIFLETQSLQQTSYSKQISFYYVHTETHVVKFGPGS
jgi:hypothetical protein